MWRIPFFRGPSPFLVLLLASLTLVAGADSADWKAGLARVKITPEVPLPMAGYAARSKPYERVEQDIFVKALALEDHQGRRAVLVTADLIGLTRSVLDTVYRRLETEAHLERAQLIFSASHTHSAPVLSLEEKTGYGLAPEDARNIVAYTRQLQDKLVRAALGALADLRPARLSWGSGVAHFAMNRREFTPSGVILGVNPRGMVDRSVPVLRVDGPDGGLRAMLAGYACHGTTLTQTNYNLCGDYAGFAQAALEEQHPGAQAMFMLGCAGDANPYPRGALSDARAHGLALAQEVKRLLGTTFRPVRGPLQSVREDAVLPLLQLSRPEIERMAANGASWQKGNARAMLAKLESGKKPATEFQCPVAVWQFGSDLTLVALSGEVVVDYVPLVERAIGPLQLWIAAYCNDVFGYVPSKATLLNGGYECRGLYAEGFFAPAAQDALIAKIRELAGRAGRTLPAEN